MTGIVMRLRLTSGEHTDVRYDDPSADDEDAVVEHVVSTLASDSGVLRCRHGDRLIVVYGRGVATLEISPRGAVL